MDVRRVFQISSFKFRHLILLALLLLLPSFARAGTVTVTIPKDLAVTKASITTEKEPRTTIDGVIKNETITFANPEPGLMYEAQLTLKDGTVLQGVDMGWYSPRIADKPNAEELTDDDRQQMNDVLKKVLSFYNVNEMTILKGNHNRAVMLVRLERDHFHSDTGDEVIWRPELWYFQNNHGGWEKPLQTDRVVRRERFATHKAYHDVVDHLKWVPELGGLRVTPKEPDLKITLPANAGVPSVQPANGPASKPAAAGQP